MVYFKEKSLLLQYRDALYRIVAALALSLTALSLFNCTEPANNNVLPTYYHNELSERTLPSVSFTGSGDEYQHITTNNGTSPTTFTLPIDTESSLAWRIYFVLSNGSSRITQVPKVSAIDLPTNSLNGADITTSLLTQHQHASLGHPVQLPQENEHFLVEHFDREKYDLDELPPLLTASRSPGGPANIVAQAVGEPDPLLSIEVGDSHTLYATVERRYYNATARLVRDVTIDTDAQKRLIIWTADNVYSGCSENCLNALLEEDDITAMADVFLRDGSNNDIYDWTTELTGPEWGSHTSVNLISSNTTTLNIFLLDIKEDKSYSGGILGYYAASNSFKSRGQFSIPLSNEMLLFYVDAPHTKYWNGNTELINRLRSRWRYIVYSVLAHEFQHMINYYQRGVLPRVVNPRTAGDPTWLNEMLSMMLEDITSQRLFDNYEGGSSAALAANLRDNRGLVTPSANRYNSEGTRVGICSGRLALYAETSYWGLSRWDGELLNYATAFAFGGYLLRNYPVSGSSSALFKRAYASEQHGIQTLLEAARFSDSTLTEERLIERWGVALLLSDTATSAVPQYYRYNFGDSGLTNAGLTLGSVNIYNYLQRATCRRETSRLVPALRVFRDTRDIYHRRRNEQFAHSFFVLAAAQNVQGTATFKVTLPPGGSLTAVAKRVETFGPSFFPSVSSGR